MSDSLQTGKYYRATQRRFELGEVVLTEVADNCERKLPCHTHEFAYFGLLLAGSYSERYTPARPSTIPSPRASILRRSLTLMTLADAARACFVWNCATLTCLARGRS